jgi:hypothetical protein
MVTTLVSGFIDITRLDNNYKNKSIDKFIEYGNKFIDIPVPKIIFIEEHILDSLHKNQYTKFIITKSDDLWLSSYIEKIKRHKNKISDNPLKDTIYYLMVQNQKTEWVRLVKNKYNFFNSYQFMWIDFGIFHLSNDDVLFTNAIIEKTKYIIHQNIIYIPILLLYKQRLLINESTVKIELPKEFLDEEYFSANPIWFMLGGMFMTTLYSIDIFADLCKSHILELLDKNIFTFEINIWTLIYNLYPSLFIFKIANTFDISMFS